MRLDRGRNDLKPQQSFGQAPWPICHTNWLNRPACRVDDVALLASVGKACIFCDRVGIMRLEVSRKFAHSCGVHWLSKMVFCVHIHHAIWIVANGASMLCPHHLLEIANRKDCILVCISCTLGEADILIEARHTWPRLQAPSHFILRRATSVVTTTGHATFCDLVSYLGFEL